MQLGTRWAFGAEPPARLPDAVVAAIREVETEAGSPLDASNATRRWTLTWLEGAPIAELDPEPDSDDVVTVRYRAGDKTARISIADAWQGDEEE